MNRTETRKLNVPLSAADLAFRASELARIHHERTDLQEHARETAKEFRESIRALEEQEQELATAVRTRRAEQEILCVWQRNDDALTFDLVSENDGEVIESRPMTTAERQGNLFPIDRKTESAGA